MFPTVERRRLALLAHRKAALLVDTASPAQTWGRWLVVGALVVAGFAATPTAEASLPICQDHAVTIMGTPEGELIVGTSERDVIYAGGGEDDVHGRRGNDIICGGRGNDLLFGERGTDRMSGGRGNDDTCYGEWFHASCETAVLD